MPWEVALTDECRDWYLGLTEAEQDSIAVVIGLLEERGASLPHPHSSGVEGSRHTRMRELRIQHQGRPYRILYAFDPRRTAILLIGGDKTGNKRWYREFVPVADRLYDEHVERLTKGEK